MNRTTKKAESRKTDADTPLSASQRQHYIEVAAYYLAEKKAFNSDCDVETWLAAEAEIDQLLAGGVSRG